MIPLSAAACSDSKTSSSGRKPADVRILLDRSFLYGLMASYGDSPESVRGILDEYGAELFVSAVSIWEMRLKHRALHVRLPEPIEKTGFFWPPGREDQQIPGVLHVPRSGAATLALSVLHGSVNRKGWARPPYSPGGPPMADRIVGIVGGSYVTLDRCYHVAEKVHFGGVSESTLAVDQVFLGAQYDEDEPIAFSTVQ